MKAEELKFMRITAEYSEGCGAVMKVDPTAILCLINKISATERERDELREQFDKLASAVGWSKEECEQVGESPFDKVEGLKNAVIDHHHSLIKAEKELKRRDAAAGGVSCQHKWMNSQGRTASGWLCEKCGDYERPIDAQPAVLPHEGVSKALRDCDWSGVSIGKKAVICAAIDALGARPAVLPPAMTYAEALKVCDWKNDQASIWVEGANWMRQQCLELGAQQQKVVELPDPVKWPEIPFKYFSEGQVFSMLDAAGVKWEVKK